MVRIVEAQRSLIAEVEHAIGSGSPEKRIETLRRVTDLFLVGAESYSEPLVDVFDDVISRLADKIETRARAELANRLAPVKNAPTTVVRALARDQAIEVAGPVLAQSARLTDEDLLACVRSNSQERLLAITKRSSISEVVGDALVTRGDKEVVRAVARNGGARFSNAGYGKLVEKSAADEELAVTVGSRRDISKEHLHALVSKASETVYKRIAASNPDAVGELAQVMLGLTGHTAEVKLERDYTQAKALFESIQQLGRPVEPAINEFARAGRFEEIVVALSTLCRLPIESVERIMSDKRVDGDLVLILAKASGLSWSTAKLICILRRGEGGLSAQDLEKARISFERLQPATAQRVVRFYQVRQAATGTAN
jgi:uncharacterized protein (DUF2336 family)